MHVFLDGQGLVFGPSGQPNLMEVHSMLGHPLHSSLLAMLRTCSAYHANLILCHAPCSSSMSLHQLHALVPSTGARPIYPLFRIDYIATVADQSGAGPAGAAIKVPSTLCTTAVACLSLALATAYKPHCTLECANAKA
jgi:hypothetical protein